MVVGRAGAGGGLWRRFHLAGALFLSRWAMEGSHEAASRVTALHSARSQVALLLFSLEAEHFEQTLRAVIAAGDGLRAARATVVGAQPIILLLVGLEKDAPTAVEHGLGSAARGRIDAVCPLP